MQRFRKSFWVDPESRFYATNRMAVHDEGGVLRGSFALLTNRITQRVSLELGQQT